MRMLLALALSTGVCASCSHFSSKKNVVRESDVVSAPFEQGMKALETDDYAQAARIFDDILVSNPGSELELVTIYNSGAAYEGLGDCPKAIDRYRQAVRASAKKFQRIEAQALFRLSLMYECVGQDKKAIAALLDSRRRGEHLGDEVVQAEIPARLAAAYSRLGNRDKALEYFAQAGVGLKAIVSRGTGANRLKVDILARTLFFMGKLSPSQRRAETSPDSFLQSISMQQPHLLQAAELNHPLFSGKAADDLELAYENLWKFNINNLSQRREFYMRGLQVAEELRKLKMPESNALVERIFAHVDRSQARLRAELARMGETTRLTPEAEKREGLKREGRLVTPVKPKKQKVR